MTGAETIHHAVAHILMMMRDFAGGSTHAHRGDTLTPVAWRLLDDNRLLNLVDPAECSSLDAHREAIWSMNAPALYTITHLSRALAAAEIPHVFIKSPLLTHALYGDYFFRMSTDVDVLVAGPDRTRALHVLDILGFRLIEECRRLVWRTFLGEQHLDPPRPGFLTVDLHVTVWHPVGYAPGLTNSILAGHVMAALGDGHVPVPNPSDTYLLAAVYFLKALLRHDPAGSHLLDLAVMHARLDTEGARALSVLASARGLRRATAFAHEAVTALLEPDFGAVSSDVEPLWRLLGGDALWTRLLAPSEVGTLRRTQCIAASCDRAIDRFRAVGWHIGMKLAHKAADAEVF